MHFIIFMHFMLHIHITYNENRFNCCVTLMTHLFCRICKHNVASELRISCNSVFGIIMTIQKFQRIEEALISCSLCIIILKAFLIYVCHLNTSRPFEMCWTPVAHDTFSWGQCCSINSASSTANAEPCLVSH